VLIRLDPTTQLLGVLAYSGISLLPLLVVSLLISGGKRLSRIQKWRESNKRFLQFAAGSGLVILGVYIYVEQVITVNVIAMGLQ
jgi:cytochrome c biogenesis protein CcdA